MVLALWDETPVEVNVTLLTPDQRHHRRAVQHTAARLKISLPPAWA
jgi:hypothetical protein